MADNRTLYYARVSTHDQNLSRQIQAFKELGATEDQIVSDKKSGKDFERAGYQALKGALGLRSGDTLVVKELDRLGRNKEAIKQELEYWKAHGVRVKVCDIPTTMQDFPENVAWIQDMVSNILIEVMSTIAEQERLKTKKRQAEGLAAMPERNGKKYSAKSGKPIGRTPVEFPVTWPEYYTRWQAKEITAKKFMDDMGFKRSTFYSMVKRWESEGTARTNGHDF